MKLTGNAITTNEQINNVFNGIMNPYNKGAFQNYLDLCCNPIPRSKVGDLSIICSVTDYIKRNVNPSKYPEIHQKFLSPGYYQSVDNA
jgi:hypothetical protein